jgi:hypothetical protein
LVVYGSTNRYKPVSRREDEREHHQEAQPIGILLCATATTMTAAVKAMDSQRWIYRTHLFQFKRTSFEDEPEADRARTIR